MFCALAAGSFVLFWRQGAVAQAAARKAPETREDARAHTQHTRAVLGLR